MRQKRVESARAIPVQIIKICTNKNPSRVRTVFLDLETTGLNPRTVEIGILGEDGQVLLDTLVRPVRHRSWPGAQTNESMTSASRFLGP